jgi:hypothetical protein
MPAGLLEVRSSMRSALALRVGNLGVRPLLFVFVLTVLLLVQQGTITGIDGESSYRVTQALVDHGDLALSADAPHTAVGRDGDYYSKFGIGLPLLGTIPYVLAKPFEGLTGDDGPRAAVATLMPVITAVLCLVLYEIGRALGARPRDAVLVALAAVFGTYLLIYSKDFFSEPLVALAIALALWRTIAGHPTQAAAFLAFGMLTRPQVAAVAPLFWLYWLWRNGFRHSVRPGLVLAAGAAALLFYNWLRFENVTESGYPPDQVFTIDFWGGAWGLLTRSNKSLFLFVPLAAALPFAIWAVKKRGQPALAALATGIVLVGFLTAASWTIWWGGWTWGPRLVLPALIPVLPLLALWIRGGLRNRSIVLTLAAIGLLVNLPAVFVPTGAQLTEISEQRGPTVARQYELIGPQVRNTVRDSAPPDDGSPDELYLWQVNAYREGGTRGLVAAALLSLLLAATALVSGVSLWRALRRSPAVERQLDTVPAAASRSRRASLG